MTPLRLLALVLLSLTFSRSTSVAQDSRAVPAIDREALDLARDLLARQPEDMQLNARLKLRDADGRRTEIPVRYTVISGTEGWQGIYETLPPARPEQLIIVHREKQPNQYVHRTGTSSSELSAPRILEGNHAAVPFAGSDFWLSDLGMEFLHWPQQRLVRDAKITMRLGRPCKVLESTNPNPTDHTYSRVESWIDVEYGGLIYAVAYDLHGKRFKLFALKGVKDVRGTTRITEMEMQNDRADTRTTLIFEYEIKQ